MEERLGALVLDRKELDAVCARLPEAPIAVLGSLFFDAGRLFNGDDVDEIFSPMFRTNVDSLSVSSLIRVEFAVFFAAACLYLDWTIRDIFLLDNRNIR